MKIYTFWIHGLEIEHAWLGHNRLDARARLLEALPDDQRRRVRRVELIDETAGERTQVHDAVPDLSSR